MRAAFKRQKLQRLLLLSTVLGFGLLAACIPSLHPLYTAQDVTYDEQLLGTWKDKEDGSPWVFSPGEEKSYKLVIHDKEKSSPFEAHLFQLNGQMFLDLYPDGDALDRAKLEDFYKASLIPGHLFFKVSLAKDELTLHALEHDWLKSLLAKDPKTIGHTTLEDRIVFTASTKEMQRFINAHVSNPEAWGDPAVFKKATAAQ